MSEIKSKYIPDSETELADKLKEVYEKLIKEDNNESINS
jgi:hypothetical protein